MAWLLVDAQPGFLDTFFHKIRAGSSGLRHHKKAFSTRLSPLPPSPTSPGNISSPSHTPLRCRSHGPQQRDAHEDSCLLVPGPTLGLELLHIYPNTHSSGRDLSSPLTNNCPSQGADGRTKANLRYTLSQPCSKVTMPDFPLPTEILSPRLT